MKYLFFVVLSMFTLFAYADNLNTPASAPSSAQTVTADQDDYAEDLDIAKAVRMSALQAKGCSAAHVHMVYVDSKGVSHDVEYTRVGNDCDHG
jgi:hypothetical protein